MRNTSWSNNNWPEGFRDVLEPTVADIFEHREAPKGIVLRACVERWDNFCRMSAATFVASFIGAWLFGVIAVRAAMLVR